MRSFYFIWCAATKEEEWLARMCGTAYSGVTIALNFDFFSSSSFGAESMERTVELKLKIKGWNASRGLKSRENDLKWMDRFRTWQFAYFLSPNWQGVYARELSYRNLQFSHICSSTLSEQSAMTILVSVIFQSSATALPLGRASKLHICTTNKM